MVAGFIIVWEIVVYFLDYFISADAPVAQLHSISIILATINFGISGAILVATSSTSLFYLANFLDKDRLLDLTFIPAVFLTFFLFILVGAAALIIIRLLSSLEETNRALADKLNQLQSNAAHIELLTAERERNRLARELHDGVAKTLFGIEYAAGALERLLPEEIPQIKMARQQAQFIQEVCRNEGQAVRDIILDLRRGYEEPLFSLIGEYLKRWQLAYSHPVHFKAEGCDTCFSPSVAYEVMAILEEALENIHRHSQAREVWVEVQTGDKLGLQLEIRDDGIGLQGELGENLKVLGYPGLLHRMQPLVGSVGDYHFGLTGMTERVNWLNGQLELTPAPEGGLRIKVYIPL